MIDLTTVPQLVRDIHDAAETTSTQQIVQLPVVRPVN